MKWRLLAGLPCENSNCPKVFEVENDLIIVQGKFLKNGPEGITNVPPDEALVAVPRQVFEAAASVLRNG